MDMPLVRRTSRSWRSTPALLLFIMLGSNLHAGADADNNGTCSKSEVDCGYYGCHPSGSSCPADCDTFQTPETCQSVKTGEGRQACLFNPQYSLGKGLCQKDVTCYDVDGKCSKDCFRCKYFGCLPSGTNCPAYCEDFKNTGDCESKGGVAGGLACQWSNSTKVCDAVPLAQLTRTLSPSPLRAVAAVVIRDGATITPTSFPTPTSPVAQETIGVSPLDWAGTSNRPALISLYVGLGLAVLGLISVSALVYYRRTKKVMRNKTLTISVRGVGSANSEKAPAALFHRESLIVHIRRAIAKSVQSPQAVAGSEASTAVGVKAEQVITEPASPTLPVPIPSPSVPELPKNSATAYD